MKSEVCSLCKQPAEHRCSACHAAFYCSREHQKRHWKQHRKQCVAWSVEQSTDLGRYLVASRELNPGDLILSEYPLVSGPRQITEPVCLGCHRLVDGSFSCFQCGWPLCGPDCETSEHHIPECYYTAIRRGTKIKISNFNEIHPMYQCITVLRCLYLKEKKPEKWSKLISLESHPDKRKDTEKYEADKKTLVMLVRQFFHLEEFSEDEIMHCCGVFHINGHEVPAVSPPYVSVYSITSLLEHNCVANCVKTFREDGSVVIRAAIPIKKGEHLTICYSDPLWGTSNRQHHLQQSKFFTCTCQRCKDPTELETYLSALRCPHCSSGTLLLKDPLKVDSEWVCNSCLDSVPPEFGFSVVDNVGKQLAALPKGDISVAQKFLNKYETSALHYNHFYLTDIRLALVQMMGSPPSLTDEDLQFKGRLLEVLRPIADIVSPGISRLRGLVIAEQQAVKLENIQRKVLRGELNPQSLRTELLECRIKLAEADIALKSEPIGSEESLRASRAAQQLAEVENLLAVS